MPIAYKLQEQMLKAWINGIDHCPLIAHEDVILNWKVPQSKDNMSSEAYHWDIYAKLLKEDYPHLF